MRPFRHFMNATVTLAVLSVSGHARSAAQEPKVQPNQGAGVQTPELRANLVRNGSFEEGPEPSHHKPLNPGSTEIRGWTVTRGQLDYIGTFWKAADGKRSIDLHGTPGHGGLQQEIATQPGAQYLVVFYLACTPGTDRRGVVVRAAGQEKLFTVDGANRHGHAMGWTKTTWRFTALRGHTTLEFASDGQGDELQGAALDNVAVFSLGTRADGGVADAATRERVDRLIHQLGDNQFVKREAASRALVQLGLPAIEQLEAAARSTDDPEVRRRAALALDKIERALAERY